MEDNAKSAAMGQKWRSHKIFILATVAIGLFTDLFLYGLIIPVLPFLLEKDSGIPPSQIQGYTSAMLAVYAGSIVIFSPLSGIVADRCSSKQIPFLFGLICLMASTVLLFSSRSISVLILSRALQGISCAFVWTCGLAICMNTVGPDHMGQTIGAIFSVTALGTLWAPFIGGWLYEATGIRGVMALALSLLGVDLVMRLLVIEVKTGRANVINGHSDSIAQPAAQGVDFPSQRQASEEQPLLHSTREAEDLEYKLPEQHSWIAKAVPIVPCLANTSLLTALSVSLVHALLMGSFDATVATLSHELFGFNSFQAGMLFLPIGIMNLICGPIVGWVVDHRGTKIASVFAFGMMVPVLVLLRLVHAGGVDQIVLYAVLLSFAGIGLAACAAPSLVEGGSVIDKYHRANPDFFGENGPYAMVYGLNGMMFNAGLTIGPAIAGGLKDTIGYGNMNLVLAVISAITALLSYMFLGNKPRTVVEEQH
ncbi:uncharacterized protein RCC_03978 [Ramularia collo-cygni]|uniref:Major facilitator superfamily (MFS) profile domain-containing protein n=1 Tax=Ramularia collo-cygni TaxID=112498 RepID=A0A2D3UT78_9PEZI|nr:uncharacterized protein RCC_03978 [Ramularia collo-cygni]CZT18138.1 uncharacterized protein RCC_03978 [Ramularia collo-cygni]